MFDFRRNRFFRKEVKPNILQRFVIQMVSTRVPKHISIIMDGNRRWANNQNRTPTSGHDAGCGKLIECFNWMMFMRIKEVTYYCFSVENFKRKQHEVDGLMEIFIQLFDLMLDEM
ncbi:dehydrodolichyl diphosphate syntase complex subunit DHDDS-like protein [Leptotrombidium deliense]|uniref:ditrans,polycis-polyprenyl diphosphate synthase [(2E,6E)-farnesyldiphosphate specific] n=1 Tax=Leptotrombidium deliense TaxID=299467 RepID=A0A443RUG4_9ACAR|nr:dehydrodolichyl diphosphate syntase complex subunit DHDDS-like protein [Leptotrombidium deliense]